MPELHEALQHTTLELRKYKYILNDTEHFDVEEHIENAMDKIMIIPPIDNIRINTVDGYRRLHETWMTNIATWVDEINTEFHIDIQDGAVYKAFLQRNGNWSHLLSEDTVAGKWKE
jgi:hypothetical protein